MGSEKGLLGVGAIFSEDSSHSFDAEKSLDLLKSKFSVHCKF